MVESLYRCFAAAFAVTCISLASLPTIGLGLHWLGYGEIGAIALYIFAGLVFDGPNPFSIVFVALAFLALGYAAIYRP